MSRLLEYVSEVTGLPVTSVSPVPGRLPAFLAQRYSLHVIQVDRRRFLGVFLKEDEGFRPAVFEKHLPRLLSAVGEELDYCLVAANLPAYVRKRLVERRIPFVVPGRQMYWHRLGLVVEAREKKRAPDPVETVSPATQAVLLLALNGLIPEPVTPKFLAGRLGYAEMTMSRALDELEANKLAAVKREGRERWCTFPGERAVLWEKALPYLRDPVRTTMRVWENRIPAGLSFVAGETALSGMTMLVEPEEPVHAIGRKGWKRLRTELEIAPMKEPGTCLLQIWRYEPEAVARDGRVDPFSLYLSLKEEQDERVRKALQEMMEVELYGHRTG